MANNNLDKLFDIEQSEEVIDPNTGAIYHRSAGRLRGHTIEIHEDLEENRVGRFHARKDGDEKTTGANMSEGGLIMWFKKHFGG